VNESGKLAAHWDGSAARNANCRHRTLHFRCLSHAAPPVNPPAHPPPPGFWSEWLLSRDRRRRIRLRQTLIAIAILGIGLGAMQYIAWSGHAPWSLVRPWTLITLGGYVAIYFAIRCGWSERWADPALTIVQMVYAVLCCASGYALAGGLRGTVFPLLMVVFVFGTFALTPRQVFSIGVFAVAVFGWVMFIMATLRPIVFDPAVERGHFMMLAAMMPTAALLAGRLSNLRSHLQNQRQALAAALERIQYLATRDELTGLVNRREMNERLDQEAQRARRSGANFCIALIDLDHFKRVNDNHGHGAGDEVLRRFAAESLRLVRGADTLARWGGEEFLLLMPETDLQHAREGTERLRRAWTALPIPVGPARLHLTLSAGVVEHGAGESIEQLVERADVALYQAKTGGRDQVRPG
jgi:diguanylate cyclase